MLQKELKKSYKEIIRAHGLARIGSWKMDMKHNKSTWSKEVYNIYGISPDQYDGTYEGFLNLIYPEDRTNVDAMIKNASAGVSFDLEYRILKSDGSIRNILQRVELAYDKEGIIAYIFGTIQDDTEMKELQSCLGKTQDEIEKIQKRFQVLVQESSDVFEIISPDCTIMYISPAVEKIIGIPPEGRTGNSALEFIDDEQKQDFLKMVEYVMENPDKRVEGDLMVKTVSGVERYLALSMSNQLDEPSISGIVINWRDITERVENQKEIEFIATHDELTKLPNRVYLKRKIGCLCEETDKNNESFSLIMLDIDGFRYVNDALGQQLGDQLIVEVMKRLKDYLWDTCFLSRYSGDQFAIIVQGAMKSWEYEKIVKDITALFKEPFKIEPYELDMTISMGISMFPYDEVQPELLINYANIALLRSKHEGKNRYKFYSADIGIQIYKQVVLRNDLLKAIERNQFQVYYQAQVNLHTNDIIAAEALIRWEHPEWGMVSPNEFISLAEETGFIVNLGNWMLREVCKNYKKWMEQGKSPIKISVNYSSIQFYERNFVENIVNIIEEYNLDPHFLIMEITESVFMKNPEKAIIDIKRLQMEGIQVALDDFGTGFSSLSYLNSFNIDILKIDRSFIKNVMNDEASTIITKSVIDLAQELRIKLVAEGIENKQQLEYLQDLNCYSGQGFLYNKPVPIIEFETLLAKKKCIPTEALREKQKGIHNRKFIRIRLPEIIEADMSVVEIDEQKYKIGSMKVEIKNIGAEGLCFASSVRLPVNKDLTLRFSVPLKNGEEIIYGYPVWSQEADGEIYEYGVQFLSDNDRKINLTSSLYSTCKEMYVHMN